ncbi:MAG TPA: GNAT family N-acetyltransferase [Ideonella sp.]|nr:GNAT family N-acetyltransferase [Ideonella sp.]
MLQAVPIAASTFALRTPRLQLRAFGAGDADDVIALHSGRRLREHLLDDMPLDRPAAAALFLDRIQRIYREHPGLGIWHASVPQSGSACFAGWFSLMPLAGYPGEIELGSRLLASHWGQGVSMDGGEALLAHAFARLGRQRVWAACHPANRGARLCLRALGFTAGTPGIYAGQPAVLHSLGLASWRAQAGLPRRERLRAASKALRDETEAPPLPALA